MELNYSITALILLVVISLLIYLIIRNQKDKKKFKRDFTKSEIEPEKHKEDKI